MDLIQKLARKALIADRVNSLALDVYLRTGFIDRQTIEDARVANEDVREVLAEIERAGIVYRTNQATLPIQPE